MLSKNIYPYLISLAAVAALVVYTNSFLSKVNHNYSEQNKAISQIADEKTKKISAALEEERRQHAQILNRLQLEYERNKEAYEQKLRALEEKKKSNISSFISRHGNNPKEMAESLSKSTGFKVYNEK